MVAPFSNWKNASCVFAHQELKNCKMGYIKSIDGDVWEPHRPMCISGHIHERQKVGDNVLYPGSVLSHAFGSDNQGISKFTFSGNPKQMSEERVDIGLEKQSIIYEDVTNIENIPKEKLVIKNKPCLSEESKDIKEFKKTKEYTHLKEKGIKVTFKVSTTPHEKSANIEGVAPFSVILNGLVEKECDPELEKDFSQIKGKQCQHTWVNDRDDSYAESINQFPSFQTNCRQIYDHVKDCPVCQKIFMGIGGGGGGGSIRSSTTYPFSYERGDIIEIPMKFIVIVLVVILLIFLFKNK